MKLLHVFLEYDRVTLRSLGRGATILYSTNYYGRSILPTLPIYIYLVDLHLNYHYLQEEDKGDVKQEEGQEFLFFSVH